MTRRPTQTVRRGGWTDLRISRRPILRSVVGPLVALQACSTPEPFRTGTLRPELAFRISGETGLTAARNLTVDRNGDVYVFDYGDYVNRKFDVQGRLLASFGGTGEEPGSFVHLMTIRALGDSLLALDEVGVSVFDLSGELRVRHPFAENALADLPRMHTDGRWIGERVTEVTGEQTLNHRGIDGALIDRLASYDLREFFPGPVPGELFFIHPVQIRTYLYDFLPDGRIVWAASDRIRIRIRGHDGGRDLFTASGTPLP